MTWCKDICRYAPPGNKWPCIDCDMSVHDRAEPPEKNETMSLTRMIELLDVERECVTTAAHNGCDRNCANCILVQDDRELFEMYTKVIDILAALNAVAENAKDVYRKLISY